MSVFTVGQPVIAKNIRQGASVTDTRKVMEIAKVIPNYEGGTGYKLRKVGSTSKGGSIIWNEDKLQAA